MRYSNISCILGRPSTVALSSWPESNQSIYLTKSIELYEIFNHIIEAQAPAPTMAANDRFGLAVLYRPEDQLSTVSRLDTSLTRFEDSLPESLKYATALEQPLAMRQQAALMFLK